MNIPPNSHVMTAGNTASTPRLGSPKAPEKTDYKLIIDKDGDCIRCLKHICDREIEALEMENCLKSHLEICSDRKVLKKCSHCRKHNVNFKDWVEHVGKCPEKFVHCSLCDISMQRCEFLEHEKFCNPQVFFDNKVLTRCKYDFGIDGRKSGIVIYSSDNTGIDKNYISDLKKPVETFLYVIIPNKLLHRRDSDSYEFLGVTFIFKELKTPYFSLDSLNVVITKNSPHSFGISGYGLNCSSWHHDKDRAYFEADVISQDEIKVQSLSCSSGRDEAILGQGSTYGRCLEGSKPEKTLGDFVALKLTIKMNLYPDR